MKNEALPQYMQVLVKPFSMHAFLEKIADLVPAPSRPSPP